MAINLRRRRALRIRLQFDERILHEIRSPDLAQELAIGRSASCAWRVPPEDIGVGSQHATLVRQGTEILLIDRESKNGTWFQGSRIIRRALRPGDRISIGHCVLIVEPADEAVSTKGVPEVTVATGPQRNHSKPLQGERFTIGSDPGSDLVLLDDYVSRQHAVIIRKDDTFWLKTLNSTNPTKLNGVPLTAGQERQIKDRDRIAVAHVSLTFHDGKGSGTERNVVRSLGVMAAVTVGALALYFGWQLLRSPATACLQEAKALKFKGDFKAAREQLDRAIGRRGYPAIDLEAAQLRSDITKCESSRAQWQGIEDLLKATNWSAAAEKLGALLPPRPDPAAWDWAQGITNKNRAMEIKRWLDVYTEAGHLEAKDLDALERTERGLTNALGQLASWKTPGTLRGDMEGRERKLSQVLEDYRRFDAMLQKLAIANASNTSVQIQIYATNTNTAPVVRAKAERILPSLRLLTASCEQLIQAIRAARDLRFQDALAIDNRLPTADQCALDSHLSELQRKLKGSWSNLTPQVSTAARLVGTLTNRLVSAHESPAFLKYWEDPANLSNLFACDSLSKPFPKSTRDEPQGEYDHTVCVEWFFGRLQAIARSEPDPDLSEPPFESRLAATLAAMKAAKAVTNFLSISEPDHTWLKTGGKLRDWNDAALGVLSKLNTLGQEMGKQAMQSDGRQALIAGGIAWHLQASPDPELRKKIAAEFIALRKQVNDLENRRGAVSSAERIAIRKQILGVGLPGDPVVKQMWQEATDATR